jgi:hypothetical protein
MGVVYRARDTRLDHAARAGDDREDWLCRDPHLASFGITLGSQQMLASVESGGSSDIALASRAAELPDRPW